MATTSLEGLAVRAPLREQFSGMWSNWTRWATSNLDKRRALALLDLSDDIALQTRAASDRAMAGIAEMLEQARARGPMRDARAGMRLLSGATCRISRAYGSAAAQISALRLPLAGPSQ